MSGRIFFLILFLPFVAFGQSSEHISGYARMLAIARVDEKDLLLLRSFQKEENSFYLVADMKTMVTSVIPVKGVDARASDWTKLQVSYANSPYIKALMDAKRRDLSLQDAGIAHGYPFEKGITLTIDLCPSQKPLDRVVFTSLIEGLKNIEIPVPVGISISGKFMLNHPDDIDWLLGMVRQKQLAITWINHSYHHYYQPGLALRENFLLAQGTDLDVEVLENEKAMLGHGIVPSVFFRFPGLVSNRILVDRIIDYGLIPIGSDAWLAKGQKPVTGSIVLIHGNGNEPLGVADFLQLLRNNEQAIRQKQWLLFDLRSTIGEEENH